MESSSVEPAATGKVADGKSSDITIHIQKMLDATVEAQGPITEKCCIYKVPDETRKLHKDDYTPKFASIGTFHYGSRNTLNMQIYKKISFEAYLRESKTNLDSLVRLVEKLESRVRSCYSEKIKHNTKDFVTIILVDAVFIINLFLEIFHRKYWRTQEVKMDLWLLENQLPFFFLKDLYNLAFLTPQSGNPSTFLQLTSKVLGRHVPENTPILHFTDLLRKSYLGPSQIGPTERAIFWTVPSATELLEIGVKFKTGIRCLLDVDCSEGIMRIPQLFVNAATEKLFHNMIALEQCHYPDGQYISDYVFLLGCLIKTHKDADILIKNMIIVNDFEDSSKLVTRLVHSLGKDTPGSIYTIEYNAVCRGLNDFCVARKARMATALKLNYYVDLKRTYCKTPLQTLATLGGIFLLVLTVIQTVCSIMQVV